MSVLWAIRNSICYENDREQDAAAGIDVHECHQNINSAALAEMSF
jgi:hypothetical protein